MASIIKRKRADGSVGWRASVRRGGLPPLHKTFDRRVDAVDWATNLEAQIARGEAMPVREADRLLLGEVIGRFVEGPLLERPSNQIPQLRARLLWWQRVMGNRALGQVKPSDIALCKERLLAEGVASGRGRGALRRRGKATINRYLTALSLVFRWVQTHLHLDIRNPVLEVARLQEPRGRERILSADEELRWLEAARLDQHPATYPLVAALCATGARLGELLYLERGGLVLDSPGREHVVIRVGSVRGTTKNRVIRAVPLWWQKRSVAILKDWLAQLEGDLVFPMPMSTAQKILGRAARAAGLEKVTSHVLRHTVATQLAEAGFTEAQLMAFFGWRTSAMAHRYVHAVPERMLQALPMSLAGRFELPG